MVPSGLNQNAHLDETPLNATFAISVLLDYTQGGVSTIVVNRDSLDNATFHFNGAITNKQGEPIQNFVTSQFLELPCEYDKFQEISSLQSQLISSLANVTEQSQLESLRYQIGTLDFPAICNG